MRINATDQVHIAPLLRVENSGKLRAGKNASGPGDLPEFESFDNASFVSQFNCLKDEDKARTRSRDENETPLTYKYNGWEGDAKR